MSPIISIGHLYTIGRHGLTLGSEYGFALGGGRMVAWFTEGAAGEHGVYLARAGLRAYFGQHDKSLIDRHRQDDPTLLSMILTDKLLAVAVGDAVVILNALTIMH